MQVIANLPSQIEKKKRQTLDILIMTDFYEFLKIDHFCKISEIFGNHQLHILKSFYVFYFMLIYLTNTMQLDKHIFNDIF